MSLAGFDTLRREHPNDLAALDKVENAITRALFLFEGSVLDDRELAANVKVSIALVQRFLVELQRQGVVEPRVFWVCPDGRGISAEEASLAEFTEVVECDRCGQSHVFDPDDVEVRFVPTDVLIASYKEVSSNPLL